MQENQPDRLTVTLQTKTVKRAAKWTLAGLLVLGLLAFLPVLGSVLTLIVTALFLAFLLDPVVNVIENRGLDRLWAVAIVFVGIICLGIVAFQFLVPAISEELHQMSQGIKSQSPAEYIAQLQTKLGNKIPILSNPEIQEGLKTKLETLMNGLLEKSISLILNLFSAVVSFIMIAFITFFFLKDGRRIKKAVVSWVPNRYFEMSLNILHKTSTQLGRYLRGQLLVAFIVGTLSVIALNLLHIRYAFFIGAAAGLANMIPYFGPIVGAVPAVIIALIDTGSLGAVAAVAVAFASIQLFENVFVSPFVVAKSVELHPLTIIIVILIGGQLMGMFGMLLAVPAASIIKVTAIELYWGLKNYRIF